VLFGTWPRRWRRKREEIALFAAWARASARPGAFDREYARLAPEWLRAADQALAELEASPYRALSGAGRRRGGLCHHNLAHHNVLLTPDGLALVDFNHALADLGVHDLANLLRRLLRLVGWDPTPGLACLEAYRTVAGFGPADLALLRPLLRFPEEGWQIGRQYYVEQLRWPKERFLAQLADKADTTPARRLCLAALGTLAGPGGEA
jgi:CotS family spore coat protein